MVASEHMQSGGGRIVTFDHKTGNEWWVEVILRGQDGGQVSGVQARDDNGAWVPLQLRSWGAWAASFHIEPGHRVQFRALWSGGAMIDSCWFTHPAGIEQCVDPFDATFTLVKGNEWWVQSQVTPNAGHTVSAVDVRINGGDWKPLRLQSWGVREWAASYHIVDGSKVQLRATDTAGSSDLSECYRWIPPQTGGQDAQVVACGAFDATFVNVRGNEWWVETDVRSDRGIARVDARVDCTGAWKPLTLRSWGSWAASFHVPSGSKVDFRATSIHGEMDGSAGYVWPQATQVAACAPPAPWPVAGSYADVRFRSDERWRDEDGTHYVKTDGLVHTEFGSDGLWRGTCTMRRDHQLPSGSWENVTQTVAWNQGPPRGEIPATVGGTADLQTVTSCALSNVPDQDVTGRETRTFSIRTSSGDPVPIDAYKSEESDSAFHGQAWWDARYGLMLNYDTDYISANSAHRDVWLLATDAQLG